MPRTLKGHNPEITDPSAAQKMAVQDATRNLAQYAEVSRQIEGEKQRLNDKIDELHAQAGKVVEPLRARRSELESSLKIFATNYRQALAEGKTIKLPTGTISFKLGKASVDTDDPIAIRSIRRLGRGWIKRFIRVSYSIRKAELLKFPEIARGLDGVTYNEPSERIYLNPTEIEVDTPATGKTAA